MFTCHSQPLSCYHAQVRVSISQQSLEPDVHYLLIEYDLQLVQLLLDVLQLAACRLESTLVILDFCVVVDELTDEPRTIPPLMRTAGLLF